MQSVTFRVPEKIIRAVDGALDLDTGESRSDFMRKSVVEYLKTHGIMDEK